MIEVGRGCVQLWECDGLGHMSAHHYARKAAEGLEAFALHLDPGGRSSAAKKPRILDHHIRFHRELRLSTPYIVCAGLLGGSSGCLRVYEELLDARNGAVAATFLSEIRFEDCRGRLVQSPVLCGQRREALATELPEHGAPRGMRVREKLPSPSIEGSNRFGLFATYRGSVGPEACDRHGRMRAHEYLARVSSSTPSPLLHSPAALAVERWDPLVQVETRLVFHRHLTSGDVFEVHSGLRALGSSSYRFVHWVFEAGTGEIAATADVIALAFDLEARRAIPIDPALRKILAEQIIPDLFAASATGER